MTLRLASIGVAGLLAAGALLGASAPVDAQVAPNLDWRTIRTQHFYVHFNPQTEGLARRTAANAERAYAQLSREMHPPRGMIDIVLSDDVDLSNGSATPYPTNRIVIYANPPVSESELRYTNDWAQLVVTHELTHIFHLDRTRGVWSLAQHVFGRAATIFPNMYAPSWLIEGLAVYEESHLTGAGRVQGSEHRMIARSAAIDHAFPAIGALSLGQGRFPFGESAYAYGSLFVDYMARTQGPDRIRTFVDKQSAELIPYLIDVPARQAFGISFSRAWRNFSDSVARSIRVGPAQPLQGWRELTRDGVYVFSPRWLGDSSIVYSGTNGKETFGAYRVDLAGHRKRIGRRNSRSANVPLADGSFLYSQLDFINPYQDRSDLWVQRGGKEHQLTHGARLSSPDARSDGRIVAEQIMPGATRLVLVTPDGKQITQLTHGSLEEQWTEPRWSHSGHFIVASRWMRGNVSQIVVLDTTGRIVHIVSSGNSIESAPSWLAGDAGVMYSSDRSGSAQIYVERFGGDRLDVVSAGTDHSTGPFDGGVTYKLSDAGTGLFEPTASPHGTRAAAVLFRVDGYHLGVGDCCDAASGAAPQRVADYRDTMPAASTAPVLVDSGRVTKYSPWRTFYPRYWLPTFDQGISGGYRIGATTSGVDVVGRHSFNADLQIPTDNTGVTGSFTYQYFGLGLPVLQLDGAQNWDDLGSIGDRTAARTPIGELFRRTRTGDALATWIRQRARTSLAFTVGAGVEYRTFTTTPDANLVNAIDTTGAFGAVTFPTVIAGLSFANYKFPSFAISPEDGISFSTTLLDRTRSHSNGTGPQSLSSVTSAALYKSLNLPGFAHHVLALRGSAGIADNNAAGYYLVGGVSGNPFQIIPGYTIGEGRKTFPVRGFEQATLIGTRAFTGSAEYRIPLALTGESPGILPFFLDRSMLALFGDYGTAWCPSIAAGREVCNRAGQDRHADIGSVGAELNVNLGVLSWDAPYRFRLGLAHPLENGAFYQRPTWQWYVAAGASF